LSEPTQDELANDTLTDEGNQINTLRKTIANKMEGIIICRKFYEIVFSTFVMY